MANQEKPRWGNSWQHSLRFKLLLPLVGVSLAVAGAVALGSFYQGLKWSRKDVAQRYQALSDTLVQSSFPLTANVVESLALLTDTELIAVDGSGSILATSLSGPPANLQDSFWVRAAAATSPLVWNREGQVFEVHRLDFELPVPRGTERLFVLFDRGAIEQAGLRAAVPPLLTGLTTIVVLSALFYGIMSHLVHRLRLLERRVARVAAGEFTALTDVPAKDEVGRLDHALSEMAGQLQALWQQLERQQKAKLLYQMAGGMAHQLRNTLTGARMALDLHAQRLEVADLEEIQVARQQLQVAEEYVHRLLLVGQGQTEQMQSASLPDCLAELRLSTSAIAKHLGKRLDWTVDDDLATLRVVDRMRFTAAVSNLVFNALQAADEVTVRVGRERDCTSTDAEQLRVAVIDDGPGVEPSIMEQAFEPFVTTKPEGLGLGLPTVQRAIEALGGRVDWRREGQQTIFELVCPCAPTRKESSK